mmetsp:Transcript_33488/g.32556  ORF Transcript_33488/g.32556 Transcript_33488/m.32556 type:complete len:87 (+) Transcript_33488:175-435(+)
MKKMQNSYQDRSYAESGGGSPRRRSYCTPEMIQRYLEKRQRARQYRNEKAVKSSVSDYDSLQDQKAKGVKLTKQIYSVCASYHEEL